MSIITRLCATFALTCSLITAAPVQAQVLPIQAVENKDKIPVWLVEDRSVPVISLSFSFDGGTSTDPLDRPGRAHFLSTMLDEGAGDLKSKEFQTIMNNNAIELRFTAGRNAFYGKMRCLIETCPTAFNMLKLALTKPRFDDEAFERMRNAISDNIRRDLKDPDFLNARAYNGITFENHPYALPGQGNLKSISEMTKEDLHVFVEKLFNKTGLMVAIAGDIDKAGAQKLLKDVFGDLPTGNAAPQPTNVLITNQGKKTVYPYDIPQSFITAGHEVIAPSHPDYPALELVNYTLGGGGFAARLMEEIRVKRGLTYGIYSALSHMKGISMLRTSMSTKNATAAESISLIKSVWQKVADQGITEKELSDAKAYLTGSEVLRLTSSVKIASWMGYKMRHGFTIEQINAWPTNIQNVTLAQANEAAKRWLQPENLNFVITGMPEGLTPDLVIDQAPGM